MLEYPPAGLQPPPWWGAQHVPGDPSQELAAGGSAQYRPHGESFGIELPGSVLTTIGLMAAPVHPEHTVLYLAEAST